MRVGAILSISQEGIAKFLGYGDYTEDVVPEEGVGGMGDILRKGSVPNPRIVLDCGKVVWGCECWWAEEDRVKERLAACSEVINVDIEQHRKNKAVIAIEEE